MPDVSWGAGNGSFSDGADWSGDTVPDAADTAVINMGGTYTVTVSGAQTAGSLTVDDASATIADNSALTVGTSLTLTAGKFDLNSGGQIDGGTISATGGAFAWDGGLLSGVKYEGTLSLTAASAQLFVAGGLTATGSGGTGSGSISLTGSGATLIVTGGETLDEATVNIGSAGGDTLELNDTSGQTPTLNLGAHFSIVQAGASAQIGEYCGGSSDVIADAGSITAGVAGGSFLIDSFNFTNSGSIAVSAGDSLTIDPLDDFDNAAGGSISVTGSGSTASLDGVWSNAGTITAGSGAILDLGGEFAAASMKGITNNGGTLALQGVLTNTGSTLDVGSGTALGTVILEGEIDGGKISASASAFVWDGGELAAVTYEGTLNLTAAGAQLFVDDGLTATGVSGSGSGVIDLTGGAASIIAYGGQTLNNATLDIGASASLGGASLLMGDPVDATPVLTLGAGFDVVQSGAQANIGAYLGYANDTIVSDGTITAGVSGGSFLIDPDNFTNTGAIAVSNDDALAIESAAFTNSGSITVSGGGQASLLSSAITNISGTTLTGGTFEAEAGSTIAFHPNNKIVSDDATLILSGAGSTIESESTASESEVTVDQTLTTIGAQGTLELLAGRSWSTTAAMTNAGTVDLGGGTFTAPSLANSGVFGGYGDLDASVSNTGTLSISAGQTLSMIGTGATLTNSGAISGAGTLALTTGSATFKAGTSLTLGKVTQSGTATTADFAASNVAFAGDWSQSSGILTVGSGDQASFSGVGDAFSGTLTGAGTVAFTDGADALAGATLSVTDLDVTGATVTLSGTTAVPNTVTAGGKLLVANGTSLTGAGAIVLTDSASNEITGTSATSLLTNDTRIEGEGQLGDGAMELTNAASGSIYSLGAGSLTLNTGTSTMINAGAIVSEGTGGLTISSPVDNTGSLIAYSSPLTVSGEVTGAGTAEVENAGSLILKDAFNENVTFASSSTGTLELGDSKGYTTGSITGFSLTGANALDLLDIPFVSGTTTATYSGTTTSGVLTVEDSANVAAIHLIGDYLGSTFTLSASPAGGTEIVDPKSKKGSGSGSPAVTHAFIAAMAAFGATQAAETVGAVSIAPAASSLLARPAPHQDA